MVDYCLVADVKPLLHIDSAESSEDAELASCVSTASALIDGLLKVKGLLVPSTVPQLVKDAACSFAAWAYRRVRDPSSAQGFWDAAQQFLQAYIDATIEPYVGAV